MIAHTDQSSYGVLIKRQPGAGPSARLIIRELDPQCRTTRETTQTNIGSADWSLLVQHCILIIMVLDLPIVTNHTVTVIAPHRIILLNREDLIIIDGPEGHHPTMAVHIKT